MYAIQDVESGNFVDMGGAFVGIASDPVFATLWEERTLPDELLDQIEETLAIVGVVVPLNVCEFTGDVCEYGECEDWCRYKKEDDVFGVEEE